MSDSTPQDKSDYQAGYRDGQAAIELFTAPGAADLTFGSLLNEMIRRMYVRCENLDPHARHFFYIECTECKGHDMNRPVGAKPSMDAVEHIQGCLMERHLPRLKAMANKGRT